MTEINPFDVAVGDVLVVSDNTSKYDGCRCIARRVFEDKITVVFDVRKNSATVAIDFPLDSLSLP